MHQQNDIMPSGTLYGILRATKARIGKGGMFLRNRGSAQPKSLGVVPRSTQLVERQQPPGFPHYLNISRQLKSFRCGILGRGQTAERLADTEFFYGDWEHGGDPWVKHRRWYRYCPYMQTHHPSVTVRASETSLPAIPVGIGSYRIKPREVNAVMDMPPVRAILVMGCSHDPIKAAIETILSTAGRGTWNSASLQSEFSEMYVDDPISSSSITTSAMSQTSAPKPSAFQTTTIATNLPAVSEVVTDVVAKSKGMKKRNKKKKKKPAAVPDPAKVDDGSVDNAAGGDGQGGKEKMGGILDEEAMKCLEETCQLKEPIQCVDQEFPVEIASYQIEPREVEAYMNTPAIRVIVEMGFSCDLIEAAIEAKQGNFPNAERLLEAIFEMAEKLPAGLAALELQELNISVRSTPNSAPDEPLSLIAQAVDDSDD